MMYSWVLVALFPFQQTVGFFYSLADCQQALVTITLQQQASQSLVCQPR